MLCFQTVEISGNIVLIADSTVCAICRKKHWVAHLHCNIQFHQYRQLTWAWHHSPWHTHTHKPHLIHLDNVNSRHYLESCVWPPQWPCFHRSGLPRCQLERVSTAQTLAAPSWKIQVRRYSTEWVVDTMLSFSIGLDCLCEKKKILVLNHTFLKTISYFSMR